MNLLTTGPKDLDPGPKDSDPHKKNLNIYELAALDC
jgi:hypothetical protein